MCQEIHNQQQQSENNPQTGSQNPMYQGMNINLNLPEKIDITMVEAKSLGDFELWTFLVSLMSNFLVGFSVAWASTPEATKEMQSNKSVYGCVSLCFLILLILFGCILIYKIYQLHKSKNVVKAKLSVIPGN